MPSEFETLSLIWKATYGNEITIPQFWAVTRKGQREKTGETPKNIIEFVSQFDVEFEPINYVPAKTTYRQILIGKLGLPENVMWDMLEAFEIKHEIKDLDAPINDNHAKLLGFTQEFSMTSKEIRDRIRKLTSADSFYAASDPFGTVEKIVNMGDEAVCVVQEIFEDPQGKYGIYQLHVLALVLEKFANAGNEQAKMILRQIADGQILSVTSLGFQGNADKAIKIASKWKNENS